jgi:hypothetical protein
MAYGALIAYRNLVWTHDLVEGTSAGDWEADAPLANLATPQLGEVGRFVANSLGGICVFEIEFDADQVVSVVGMMNAIFFGADSVQIALFDAADDPIINVTDLAVVSYSGKTDYVPVNFWHVFDTPQTGVRKIVVTIQGDGALTPIHTIGGLWISDAMRLDTVDAGWRMNILENAIIVEADGNQTRTMPARKYRQITFKISAQNEEFAFGIDGTDAISIQNSLLDLFLYSGKSRPIVAFPRLSTQQRMSAMGVYGYMTGNLGILTTNSGNSGDSSAFHSSDSITVRESL